MCTTIELLSTYSISDFPFLPNATLIINSVTVGFLGYDSASLTAQGLKSLFSRRRAKLYESVAAVCQSRRVSNRKLMIAAFFGDNSVGLWQTLPAPIHMRRARLYATCTLAVWLVVRATRNPMILLRRSGSPAKVDRSPRLRSAAGAGFPPCSVASSPRLWLSSRGMGKQGKESVEVQMSLGPSYQAQRDAVI